jgi:hypothetical protein
VILLLLLASRYQFLNIGTRLLGEMADFRVEAGKVQDESGTFCCARKQGRVHRMKRIS